MHIAHRDTAGNRIIHFGRDTKLYILGVEKLVGEYFPHFSQFIMMVGKELY